MNTYELQYMINILEFLHYCMHNQSMSIFLAKVSVADPIKLCFLRFPIFAV